MKQKVGAIIRSTDIGIVQHGRGTGIEQEVGRVSDSERVEVRQDSEVTLESSLADAVVLLDLLREVPSDRRSDVSSAVVPIVTAATDEVLPREVSIATVASAAIEQSPAPLKATIRDLAAAVGATSGAIAVGQLPVELLAIGVPAVLGITGYLAAPELRMLYSDISARVRACLSRKSGPQE